MVKLDKKEKELLDSVENGDWKSAPPTGKELQKYLRYARNTLRKNRRVNIRPA